MMFVKDWFHSLNFDGYLHIIFLIGALGGLLLALFQSGVDKKLNRDRGIVRRPWGD